MLFFLVSFIVQAAMKAPMYVDNLNWICDANQSFLYSDEKGQNVIKKHLQNVTCATYFKNHPVKAGTSPVYCEPLTNNYYCKGTKDDVSEMIANGAVPFS